MDLLPKRLSPLSFLALAWAKRDFGLALLTCLFRRALILAEQGLMMLSDGETYCLVLIATRVLLVGNGKRGRPVMDGVGDGAEEEESENRERVGEEAKEQDEASEELVAVFLASAKAAGRKGERDETVGAVNLLGEAAEAALVRWTYGSSAILL